MSKLIGAFLIVLVIGVLAIGITNLVFTIKVFNKQKEVIKPEENVKKYQKAEGNVSTKAGFQEAATQLLRGIDLSVDPCTDFYAFTCNNYLKSVQIPAGDSRIGTYDEAQIKVFNLIANILNDMDVSKVSLTEKITKNVYDRCMENANQTEVDKSQIIYDQIKNDLKGIPMFDDGWSGSLPDILKTAGQWEGEKEISTLFDVSVTADDGNPTQAALYLGKPSFLLALDYYIKPQFLAELDAHRVKMVKLFKRFAKNINKDDKNVDDAVKKILQFQVQLALNFIPNDLLKNALLQYNNYTIDQFNASYPAIGQDIFTSLLNIVTTNETVIRQLDFMVTEPRYYRALDGMLQDSTFDLKVLANFMTMQYLIENGGFIGGKTKELLREIKAIKFSRRQEDFNEDSQDCLQLAQNLMPYGTGYIYIKNMTDTERKSIVEDVTTQVEYVIQEFLNNVNDLKWMTDVGKASVNSKAGNVTKNIAYPNFFQFDDNGQAIDKYHVNYQGLESGTDFFQMIYQLKRAHQKTENLGKLLKPIDRHNFQDSPATVNAWYEPTLNSITIPRAALNEPYYRLDFPQAYNYAGNGGTIGHELTHGFDSDGVQYNGLGGLAPCTYQFCTILDGNSSTGFLDMAQCVISQYNEQCCPLQGARPIHCTNGVNTQGENIADIGGQYAAYKAYRHWIEKNNGGKEEDLLPGLDQFTGNQIFWITYGFSWCMKQEEENLAHQLLTNEHAPGICRVNQVMQDLPEFAKDFGCKPKSPLAPENRCNVWR